MKKSPEKICKELILILSRKNNPSRKELVKLQRRMCAKYGISFFKNIKLLKTYHNLVKNKEVIPSKNLQKLLTMKHVRSLSGIVVVSLLTKPYSCPGKCIYCPTEKNVPKSYLSNEPAVMRAIALNYDPYIQTIKRLEALKMEGHPTDKINIRIIGGTWSAYPKKYQYWFISEVFRACNSFEETEEQNNIKTLEHKNKKSPIERRVLLSEMPVDRAKRGNRMARVAESEAIHKRNMSLKNLQYQNESAKHRVVEISIETRQDFIDEKEIKHLRKLGVTKIELGVQSIYNDILKLNKRGHTTRETIDATKLLKDAGFKVSYQIMLNLYGSDIKRDKKMFKEIFSNSDFKPDHIKIYPLALVKNSNLYKLYLINKFKPYTKNQLIKILMDIKKEIPYYCRIERVIRDIPAESIVEGGTKFSNMRQILQKNGLFCKCIRCREIKERNNKNEKIILIREKYQASDGIEYFLSFENKNRTKLYSMLRLRITSQVINNKKHFIKVLDNSAIIREIHTYGQQIEISKKSNASQHQGLGKLLIQEAEKISKEFGLKKIAVIAGVGARAYFRKFGYELKDDYMAKKL